MAIKIRPLTILEKVADAVIWPLMKLSTFWSEAPQQTHKWNNRFLTKEERAGLDRQMMVLVSRDPEAQSRRPGSVRFHLPRLGGWKKYTVVEPVHQTHPWYIGWMAGETWSKVSRVPQNGRVRSLRGPDDARAFGIDGHGAQIPLQTIGEGTVGDNGPWRKVPLL